MENVLVMPNESKINVSMRIVLSVVRPHLKTCLKIVLTGIVLYNLSTSLITHHQQEIVPVQLDQKIITTSINSHLSHSPESITLHRTKSALFMLECDAAKLDTYTTSCYLGSRIAGVDPVLIACIMWTESRFKPNAKSSMGYKGVMQTPTATGYVEVDTMHGCVKLRDHMAVTHGNLIKALTNYKGSKRMILADGSKSKGYQQALEVMELYAKTKRSVANVR